MKSECPFANDGCRYAPDCYADTDHYYWPGYDYKTRVERDFRELPENKDQLCRDLHDQRHATEEPPDKPTRDFMVQALKRAGQHRK